MFNLANELTKGSRTYKISELFSQEVIENADQEYQQYRRIFQTIIVLVLGIIGLIAVFMGRRIKNSIKYSKLDPKRKILHSSVLISGLVSGLIFVLLLGGPGMANLLGGNYLQFENIASIAPVLLVLFVTGGYTVLVGIYNYWFRRSHNFSIKYQEEAVKG